MLEQATAEVPEPFSGAELQQLKNDFGSAESPWTAADLLSAAVALGASDDDITRAARLIVSTDESELELARELGNFYLSKSDGEQAISGSSLIIPGATPEFARIAKLRAILVREPRSAVRWIDLALAYLSVGEMTRARRAVLTALALQPNNRFVVRSAVRFFVHAQDPETAIRVLDESGRVLDDPWLLSAHMSVRQVQGRPIQHIKNARILMHEQSVHPFGLSELRGSIATEEVIAGKTKSALSLITDAMTDPTDNTVAQAAWGIDKGFGDLAATALERPHTSEAQTITLSRDEKWPEALAAAREWIADEPFSARAFTTAAYIAGSRLLRFAESAEIAKRGLALNPSSYLLANNAAFALANLNLLDDASEILGRYREFPSDQQRWIMTATRGLVHFRRGEIEEGRAAYEAAWRGLRSIRDDDRLAALCLVMWAREEILARTEFAGIILERASTAAGLNPAEDVLLWLDRLTTGEMGEASSAKLTRLPSNGRG